jgi:hypothetical protein
MNIKIFIFYFSFQVNLATQFFVLDFVIKINKIKLKQEHHKKFLNIGGLLTVLLMTQHWVDPMTNCIEHWENFMIMST